MKKTLKSSDVLQVLSEVSCLKPREINEKSRKRHIVTIRQIGMYLSCKYTDDVLDRIGYTFGKRNHTTAMHGRDTISDLLETNQLSDWYMNIYDKANEKLINLSYECSAKELIKIKREKIVEIQKELKELYNYL